MYLKGGKVSSRGGECSPLLFMIKRRGYSLIAMIVQGSTMESLNHYQNIMSRFPDLMKRLLIGIYYLYYDDVVHSKRCNDDVIGAGNELPTKAKEDYDSRRRRTRVHVSH